MADPKKVRIRIGAPQEVAQPQPRQVEVLEDQVTGPLNPAEAKSFQQNNTAHQYGYSSAAAMEEHKEAERARRRALFEKQFEANELAQRLGANDYAALTPRQKFLVIQHMKRRATEDED